MRKRHDVFNSPTIVFCNIARDRENGRVPRLQDIDWHIEDCLSGRFPEAKRPGAPSKYHEHLDTAKKVVRARQLDNRDNALYQVAELLCKDQKTIEKIYDKHREHAEGLVRQEDIVGGVAKLIDSIGLDGAVSEIANLFDLPVWEVRLHFDNWSLNFPKALSRLAECSE